MGLLRVGLTFFCSAFATVLLSSGVARQTAHAQGLEDPVVFALSARHFSATAEELEQTAGGEAALVRKLLELRTKEQPPFVGIRAEKLLLSYADRPEVVAALEEDLTAPGLLGLARTVTVHLDQVADSGARQRLARAALQRARSDADFARYARTLLRSEDPEVSRLAREALPSD